MTSERAVALAIECADDDLRIDVLRDMKSELGKSTLRRFAEQEPVALTRTRTQCWLPDEEPDAFVCDAEQRNAEIETATRGLAKLKKARAAGKSRHAR